MDERTVSTAEGGKVPEGTVAAGGVPEKGTSKTAMTDAANEVQQLKARYEKDISALRSTYDRKIAELNRQLEAERNAWLKKFREAQMASMPEDEKQNFIAKQTQEEIENMKREREQLLYELQRRDEMWTWFNWFVQKGVPVEKLDTSSPDALLETGWQAHDEMIANMKKELETLKSSTQQSTSNAQAEEVKAPEVLPITPGGKPPKATWSDLVKKYGSEERVYELVETGELSPDIIP